MKIAYVTTFDVLDRPGWERTLAGFGGAGYYFTRALERLGVEIDYLGPLETRLPRFGRLKARLYRRLLGQRYHPRLATSVYRGYARQVGRKLAGLRPDLVLSQESGAVAYLEQERPLALWTDAPYAAQFDYFRFLTGLCRETRQALVAMERAAVSRSCLVMYASDWAAQAAVERYRPDPDKVRVVPWGANLDDYPSSAEIERLVRARPVDRCRLLFCGLDSEDRKRGGLCVEIAAELNRRGLPTELTLIGSRPTGLRAWPDFVDFVGFVDKSTVEGRARLAGALAAAHFLLFPSRAETFGHVLGEANAFGVPCLASQTGGIPTAIRDGVNGKLFALEAGASDYCDAITAHLRDVPGYHELARSAYAEFRSRLNYDAAARTALALLEARLAGVAARPRST